MTRLSRHYIWLASLICIVGAVASPIAAHGEGAPSPATPDVPPMPAGATVATQVTKLATQIAATPAETPRSSLSNSLLHVDDAGRMELAFHSANRIGPVELADVERLGVAGVRRPAAAHEVEATGGYLQGWLPYDQLGSAAALPWVRAIRPPAYPHLSVGPTTSEGVAQMQASALHAKGITGSGVKVGVVSDGVTSLATAQAAGELPANVTVVGTAGEGDEGTAMLEIVHDVAPGAALYFATVGDDALTFLDALDALVAAGVNVIVHDVGFIAEPIFEQGLVPAVIDEISRSSGVAIYASAGNSALDHVRMPAVGTGKGPDNKPGPFAGCTKQPTNTVALTPNGDTTFDVGQFAAPAPEGRYILQWSEPTFVEQRGGFTNLDLFLMDESLTTCIAESLDVQADGVGATIEGFAPDSPAVDTEAKLVVNVAGTSSAVAPPTLDLRWYDVATLDTPTPAKSISPNNNFTSGLPAAVGAVDSVDGQPEPYSSQGPVELVLTTTCPGGAPGPCTGVAGPAPQIFEGPAFAATTKVAVSGAGGFDNPFEGTSASVPHAGACDALVRQAIGTTTAPILTVRNRMTASAKDIGTPGVDTQAGAGLLDCLGASRISNLSVSAAATPEKVKAGDTLTYTLTIKNDGPDPSVAFAVQDTLPIGLTLAGAPANCAAAPASAATGQIINCSQPAMTAGQSVTLTLAATVGSMPVGTTSLINGVALASPFDNTPADNVVTTSTLFDALVADDVGGPIEGELARTGENGSILVLGMGLILAGASLWRVKSGRWTRRRASGSGR